MAVDYKKQIGFTGPFYIEPKPKEPTKHQYDSDAAACLNFLRTYDLLPHFKLNLETNHATLAGHEMMHELEVAIGAGRPGLDRRQHRRPAARLGHRPVPDRHLPDDPVHALHPRAWAASPPAASTSTPRSAARASSRSTCSTPTSAAWTPSPAASRSPTRSSPTAGSPRSSRSAIESWDCELGRRDRGRPGQLRRPRGLHPPQGRRRHERQRPAGDAREPDQRVHLSRRRGAGDRRARRPRSDAHARPTSAPPLPARRRSPA